MDVGTAGEFEQALEQSDELIRLTADIAVAKSYTVHGTETIDLNGHSLTADIGNPIFNVTEGGHLTMKGGNASNRTQVAIASGGGEIVVESGTYTSSRKEPFRAGIDGRVTVNGGKLTGQEGAVVAADGMGTIEVNGGELVGLDNFAISTNGSEGRGGNLITVHGGRLEGNIKTGGYEAIGVYIANNDEFVMTGGEIIAHGGTGICMRAGRVFLAGGSITATNVDKNGNIVADGKIGDDPTIMTGCSAVIFHETSNYPGQREGEMSLTVDGATITGVDHSIQVLSEAAEPKVYVVSGTFNPPYLENAGE